MTSIALEHSVVWRKALRAIRTRCLLWSSLAGALSALAGGIPTSTYEDVVATIDRAHDSASRAVPGGRISAVVRRLGEGHGPQSFFVKFAFKGDMTRCEEYSLVDGKQGDLVVIHVDDGERSCGYYQGANAYIDYSGIAAPNMFYRQLGRDFHPDMFIRRLGSLRAGTVLRNMREEAGQCDLSFRPDGLIEIKAMGTDDPDNREATCVLVLDPAIGYRPVEVRSVARVPPLVHEYTACYDKGFSGVFPRTVCQKQTFRKTNEELVVSGIEIEITAFSPEPISPDDLFTFEGLNVPAGTLVSDKIGQITFRYNSTVSDEEVLKNLLNGGEPAGLKPTEPTAIPPRK